jgi:hypothetical protein
VIGHVGLFVRPLIVERRVDVSPARDDQAVDPGEGTGGSMTGDPPARSTARV